MDSFIQPNSSFSFNESSLNESNDSISNSIDSVGLKDISLNMPKFSRPEKSEKVQKENSLKLDLFLPMKKFTDPEEITEIDASEKNLKVDFYNLENVQKVQAENSLKLDFEEKMDSDNLKLDIYIPSVQSDDFENDFIEINTIEPKVKKGE